MRTLVGVLTACLFLTSTTRLSFGAQAPAVTVGYQPMTDIGLTTGQPFEAWLILGDANPMVPGYALPARASIRVTFPAAFVPEPVPSQGATLLYGWS
jgi:hypothetical protein